MISGNQKDYRLVTDLYHIGKESSIEFKISSGINFGYNSLKMDEERSARTIIASKFSFLTQTAPQATQTFIIIKISCGNGKVWSGGQRTEVLAITTFEAEQGGWYIWQLRGESGDHIDLDPMAQQFTISFWTLNNEKYVFDAPYLIQLSILDN